MFKKILFILGFVSLLFAGEDTNIYSMKKTCLQTTNYEGKTLTEQKKILIEKAKQESLEELYGSLILSSTDIENGKLKKDEIKSRAVGAVRVKGNPVFKNGKNLGEICADVTSYITPADLEKYSPREIKLSHFCFNDTSVAMKNIKTQAKLKAYKEMIVKYKPSMKDLSLKQAESLIHGFNESNVNFDFDSASYCFDAQATILPYELEMTTHVAGTSATSSTLSSDTNETPQVVTNKDFQFQLLPEDFDIGDTIEPYSENVIVTSSSNKLFFNGLGKNGHISINEQKLSGDFQVNVECDWNDFSQNISLQSDNAESIEVSFVNDNIIFSNRKESYSSTEWRGGASSNTITLIKKENKIYFYLNGRLFAKKTVDEEAKYNKIVVSGIKSNDRLYSISAYTRNNRSNTNNKSNIYPSSIEVGERISTVKKSFLTNLLSMNKSGKKYFAPQQGYGHLKIGEISYTKNFQFEFEADWNDFTQTIQLENSEGKDLFISFTDDEIIFGNMKKSYGSTAWAGGSASNKMKLVMKNGKAKFFINNQLFAISKMKHAYNFTSIDFFGVKSNDYLNSINIREF